MQQQTKLIWYQVGATYEETERQIGYVPKRYYKYKKLWNEQFKKKLAEHILWDYVINLEPRTHLRFFLMYKLIETKN